MGLGLTRRDAIAEAERVMGWLGISHLASAIAGALPYTDERRVAVGRAIMCNPRYLQLDEPAAGMSEHESHDLAAVRTRAVPRTTYPSAKPAYERAHPRGASSPRQGSIPSLNNLPYRAM